MTDKSTPESDPNFIPCLICGKNSTFGVIGFKEEVYHKHYCTYHYYQTKGEWVPKSRRDGTGDDPRGTQGGKRNEG